MLTCSSLLVTSVPETRRNMLRLTAKATQFGRRTFTSWLIESAGTVPLQRKRDHPDGSVDNSQVMAKLVDVSLWFKWCQPVNSEGVRHWHWVMLCACFPKV